MRSRADREGVKRERTSRQPRSFCKAKGAAMAAFRDVADTGCKNRVDVIGSRPANKLADAAPRVGQSFATRKWCQR